MEHIYDKVQLNRNLLQMCPLGHFGHSKLLYFLAESLLLLFLHSGKMSQKDLEEAAERAEEYLNLKNGKKASRFPLLYALAVYRARRGARVDSVETL